MKKIIITLSALFALSFGASAQQALWGGVPVVSPEIHPDNTVTFRLKAPKAVKVQVTGDFLPAQVIETPRGIWEAPGIADLKEVNGVWEFTTAEPLAPELYFYNFFVDGLKINDPSNVHMIRDVASVFNVFHIGSADGRTRADLYAVHDVPHGTVSRIWYPSPKVGFNRRLTVYTPAGYEQNLNMRYPVLYLFHGAGGDEEAWIALGRTAQILDNLIAQGKAKPMIVVMTNEYIDREAVVGEASCGYVSPSMQAGPQREIPKDITFVEAFPDIQKFIDRTYRTIAKKSSRAVAGLSMGGFFTTAVSKQYPDLFDYMGVFSAGMRLSDDPAIRQKEEAQFAAQFARRPKLYWIGMGKTDFLYDSTTAMREYFDSKGYKYTYYESEGGHIWRNWRTYLSEFAPLLFK